MDDESSPRPSRCLCEVQFELSVFIGTKRIDGLPTASQIASASAASFFPLAPPFRYGATNWGAINLTVCPIALSLRAQ